MTNIISRAVRRVFVRVRDHLLASQLMVVLGIIPILSLPGCQTTSGWKSEAQWAYDACISEYNSEFRFLDGPKAMVSGQSDSRMGCFWVWDVAEGTDAAIAEAMSDCREKYAASRCYVYATGSGLRDWAQNISDNGGTDPSMSSSQGSYSDGSSSMDAFVSGFSSAFGMGYALGGGGGYGGGSYGGGGSSYGSGGSSGGSVGGSGGGGGVVDNCYNGPGVAAHDPVTCELIH